LSNRMLLSLSFSGMIVAGLIAGGLIASAAAQTGSSSATPTSPQTSAQASPQTATQSAPQTAPPDETHSFERFTYSVGGGLGIGKDDVARYVGNSYFGVVSGGMNFTRMFGADVEYMYYGLGFRPSVENSQALPNQSGDMQSISLNGVINVPRHLGKLHAYGILGLGFYRRSVSVNTQFLQSGTPCQPAWRWWNLNCGLNGVILTPQTMSSNTVDAGGFNYGAGVTYPINDLHNAKFFLEFRYHRAYQADGQTIVMPVTVGLRW
jgi:Outer membrane protein beta-barrel domain